MLTLFRSLVQCFPEASLGISVGIRLGIDGVNPVHYDTMKVCDPFFFHVRSIGIHQGAVHTPTISWHSRRPSIFLVGSQVDNMFYLDPHHTHQTIPLRPPKQTSERGIPDRPSHAREEVCVTPRPSSFACIQSHRLIYPIASHRPYQNNFQQVAPPQQAHTFIRTLSARMTAG